MKTRLVIAAAVLSSSLALAQSTEAPLPPPPMVDADSAPALQVADSKLDAADAPPARRNRFTWGPLVQLGGATALEYERAVSDSVSFFVGPRFATWGGFGVGGSVGTRFFFKGARAPSGFWAGPEVYVDYFRSSTTVNGAVATRNDFTALALGLVGYTAIATNGWTYSVGIGGGAGYADWRRTGMLVDEGPLSTAGSYSGVIPSLAAHANIGWAF